MNQKNKTTLQFAFATLLFASFAIASCNNEGDSKEAAKDSATVTEKPMEATPAPAPTVDTMTAKPKDTASTRPTPGGS